MLSKEASSTNFESLDWTSVSQIIGEHPNLMPIYMCVWMYVYIYICVCVYIYIYMCVYVYIYIYVCVCVCMFIYIYVCVCVCICVCVCVCTYIYVCVCMYIYISYLPTPPLGQDMTQGQFLSEVLQVWIQSFPSPRLVASPRLKNLVCPTIYP